MSMFSPLTLSSSFMTTLKNGKTILRIKNQIKCQKKVEKTQFLQFSGVKRGRGRILSKDSNV